MVDNVGNMKNFLRITIVLVITAASSGALLSIANLLAANKIIQNQVKAIEDGIKIIEPAAEEIIEKEKDLYELADKDDKHIGYVFLTEGQGYAGPIKILCGVDAKIKRILGIEIIESTETPGLGARINEAWFKDQFKGLNVNKGIVYLKGKPKKDNQIEAITGATISSKSVTNILNKAVKDLRKKLNK